MKNELLTIFKALSEQHRLFILASCSQDEFYTCQLVDALELSQSTVSNHMKILKDAGLLNVNKYKTWSGYYLNPELDDEIMEIIKAILRIVYRDKQWQTFHEKLLRQKEIMKVCDY